MIVDFIGLPASGKTTICKKVYTRLKEESIKINYPLMEIYEMPWGRRNLYKGLKVLSYIVKNLKKTFSFSKIIFSHGQARKKDYFRIIFNNIFLFSIQEKYKNSNEVYIIDEGVIHHIWAITIGALKEIDIIKLLSYYETADLTIRVNVSKEIINKRNENRNFKNEDKQKRRLNDRHKYILSNIDKESKRITEILDNIEQYKMKQNKNYVLNINNDNIYDLDNNINKICEEIRKRVEGSEND